MGVERPVGPLCSPDTATHVTPRQKPPKVGFGGFGDGARVRRRAACAPGLAFRDDSWRYRYALGVFRTLVYVATARGGVSRSW